MTSPLRPGSGCGRDAKNWKGDAMRARQTRFSKALRRLWQDRSGAAVLEFALVLPPLCLILIGMFEVAGLMFTQAAMEGGLREAARYGMTGQLATTPVARAAQIISLIDKHTLNFVDMSQAVVTTAVHDDFGESGDDSPGEPLTYDKNGNGTWDAADGDEYNDVNGNGKWDAVRTDAGTSGQIVEYTVDYDYKLMTGFMAKVMGAPGGKVHLKASVVLRNEPWPASLDPNLLKKS
jgi:Flp pilus assembly protein TadG